MNFQPNYENSTNVFAPAPARPPPLASINVTPAPSSVNSTGTALTIAEPVDLDFDETQVRAYSKKVPNIKPRSTNPILRYSLLACAAVIQLGGAAIFVLIAWLKFTSRLPLPSTEESTTAAAWPHVSLTALVFILLGVAFFVLIVGCFGCCSVFTKRRILIIIYVALTVVALIFTISTVINLIVRRTTIAVDIGHAIDYMVLHYYRGGDVIKGVLDAVHLTFDCCGNSGCQDFRLIRFDVPSSCAKNCVGCREKIKEGITIILVILCLIAVAQLISGTISILYCVSITRRQNARGQTDKLRMNTINNTLVNAAYQSDEMSVHTTGSVVSRAPTAPRKTVRQSYINACTMQPIE